MPVFVGLLRAVNVGGRTLSMADLRALVTDLGGDDVRTYLQSGNLVFRGSAACARSLERAVTGAAGYDVRVLLRKPDEMNAVVAGQPMEGPEQSWHVTFLADKPSARSVQALDPAAYEPDTFAVVGREVFLRVPNGYGRSKLTNALFEKKLATAATTRNWRTVSALAAMAAELVGQ